MKKTLLGLIAVLLLGVGAYFAMQEKEVTSTINGSDAAFSVEDTSQITRFFISKKTGKNFHFVKQADGEWIVNDSWRAEKGLVNMILGTIYEMRVKTPVPKGYRNGVIRTLAGAGIKVELYNKEGIIKTFYVGDGTADQKGTYMIMQGSEQPYIVHIPRFDGYLTTRFQVEELAFKDKVIFEFTPQQIKSIVVEYPTGVRDGFVITRETVNEEGIDAVKVNQYISEFQKIHAEQFAVIKDEEMLTDSLSGVKPVAIIGVEAQDDSKSAEIMLYEAPNDNDRMLGYISATEQYVWVQYFVFGKLMVDKSYFAKPVVDL